MSDLNAVLMNENEEYVAAWGSGIPALYTLDLEEAQVFHNFENAHDFLITRTYQAGRAGTTYDSGLHAVCVQIETRTTEVRVLA